MKKFDPVLNIRNRAKKKPQNIIKGVDPIAVSLLKQMYQALKDRGANLNTYERVWVDQIEKIYSDKETFSKFFLGGLDTLLNQAYEILGNQRSSWDKNEEDLYTLYQKILFLKARDGAFKGKFDEIEVSIFSALQLDFSKRISHTKIGNSQENIFTYAAVMLNMLFEKLEHSVVSTALVDNILNQMPGILVLLSDKRGKIKYANDEFFRVVKIDQAKGLKKMVSDFITPLEINKDIQSEEGYINVHLSLKDEKVPVSARVITNNANEGTDEVLYIININQTSLCEASRIGDIDVDLLLDELFIKFKKSKKAREVNFKKEVFSFSYRGDKVIFPKLLKAILQNRIEDCRVGKSNNINVRFFEIASKQFILLVEDNGTGFKKAHLSQAISEGFKEIKELISSLHGKLEINSVYMKGTTLKVYLQGMD